MKRSEYFQPTLKEVPSDAEVISHKLMIRAGLIRRLTSGVYSYLPSGLKVLQKIQEIIRQEMNACGALEVLLPAIHPKELWDESGRWELYGENMFHLFDRRKKPFCLAPTHEEAITNLVRSEVRSYRDLPLLLYQIQTKFRDEARPRFGTMRAKEFLMKDAYSFHADPKSLEETYKKVYDAYVRIFKRCGLDCQIVEADPGLIGGGLSNEFVVLAPCGEDTIVLCNSCGYRANSEKVEKNLPGKNPVSSELKKMEEVNTPEKKTVEEVAQFLKIKPSELVKTLIYFADDSPIAVLVAGDREINESKLMSVIGAKKLFLAGASQIEEATGGPSGFSGPVGLKIKTIADISIKGMSNFVIGANKADTHFINVNIERDFKVSEFVDVKMPKAGDPCPKCGAKIELGTGIELGHTFNLGTRYSSLMNAKFLDEKGVENVMLMGCYGIGVSRIISAVIEQHNDENGIIWPKTIAPFDAIVIPLNMNDEIQKTLAFQIYEELLKKGLDVLLDDRQDPAGAKFKDADLIGIPLKIVLGDRALKEGNIEMQIRSTQEKIKVKKEQAVEKAIQLCQKEA